MSAFDKYSYFAAGICTAAACFVIINVVAWSIYIRWQGSPFRKKGKTP